MAKTEEKPPPGPPAMHDPFAAPTPESAHKDCAPAHWDGLRWVCTNHQPPQFVAKAREAFKAAEGTRAPRPSPMHEGHGGAASVNGAMQERDALAKRVEALAGELATVRGERDVAKAEAAKHLAALQKLRAEATKKPPAKKAGKK